MAPSLAAQVVREELGDEPERLFLDWDPVPVAAASIGQVHRAITHDGRAVAVKVQYPGIARSLESDLRNVALLRRVAASAFPGLDTRSMIEELGERMREEVDYLHEAENQRLFAEYYQGHPTIHVPDVVPELSSSRVLTAELVSGARFDELLTWAQRERDLAAETIDRFVFRSLYRLHAFNGDPQPGNYLFHGGGRVTFLDFGLVKHFTDDELAPLIEIVETLCLNEDPEAFRRAMEGAGFLQTGAPVPTADVVAHMSLFYDSIRERGPRTMTTEYSSAVARRYVDFKSPLAAYAKIPRSYVIVQRINLGLFAILGQMNATADWRSISEEIWPFVQAPPSTSMAEAELPWLAKVRA
jgi:predicted unusual protein kinase regulating ubiquinone biosynthesis (AarF/ABC1/UbiB family)